MRPRLGMAWMIREERYTQECTKPVLVEVLRVRGHSEVGWRVEIRRDGQSEERLVCTEGVLTRTWFERCDDGVERNTGPMKKKRGKGKKVLTLRPTAA